MKKNILAFSSLCVVMAFFVFGERKAFGQTIPKNCNEICYQQAEKNISCGSEGAFWCTPDDEGKNCYPTDICYACMNQGECTPPYGGEADKVTKEKPSDRP